MISLSRLQSGFGFMLCSLVVIAAVVLGGGTRSGHLSDFVLQLLALPLLLVTLWQLGAGKGGSHPGVWAFCAAVVLVPLVQTVPLPPFLWAALPNRQPQAELLELIGAKPAWQPLSVFPTATRLSLLSLIVPLAVFWGTLLLDYRQRRWLSLTLIGITVASVFLGLTQIAQGPASSLRFFEVSNLGDAVGFFANRNHFAALLYAATVFGGAWVVDVSLRSGAPQRGMLASQLVAIIASCTALVMLIAAQAMARSRAGLAITVVALAGILLLAFFDRRKSTLVTPGRLLVASVVLAAVFSTQFALYRIMERFAVDPLQDARIGFTRTTIEAAKLYMPFGSGMGTFVPVYEQFEKPADLMVNKFANRAHNDFVELWLESGVAGIILMAVFLGWFLRRATAAWRSAPINATDVDAALARAASLVIALLLMHSFLDYPLRTGAVMAVFAFASALLIPPTAEKQELHSPSPSSKQPAKASSMSPDMSVVRGSHGPPQRWGENIDWPDAWDPSRRNNDRP